MDMDMDVMSSNIRHYFDHENDTMYRVITNVLSVILPNLGPPTLNLLKSSSKTIFMLPSGNNINNMNEMDLLDIFTTHPSIFPRLHSQIKPLLKDMIRIRDRGGNILHFLFLFLILGEIF